MLVLREKLIKLAEGVTDAFLKVHLLLFLFLRVIGFFIEFELASRKGHCNEISNEALAPVSE